MKKNVILSCVLLVVLSMISCVEDEQMYSCNKTINDWAKSNLSEIRSMTMSDWLLIPEVNYQRAAYVAFTPTQKLNFWIEKLNSVLQMDWDEKERKHIKEMYYFIVNNPFIFNDKRSDEEMRVFDLFMYNWHSTAKKELKWSQNLLVSMIATGYPLLDKKGNIQMPRQLETIQTGSEELCECHAGNIFFIACGGSSPSCEESENCIATAHGWGALMVESCNGMCDYY